MVKYAVVAVDYFTKWAEAKPLSTISSKKVQEFVWESIICRFEIPYEIVSIMGGSSTATNFALSVTTLGSRKLLFI